jgi:hypothetical protein
MRETNAAVNRSGLPSNGRLVLLWSYRTDGRKITLRTGANASP